MPDTLITNKRVEENIMLSIFKSASAVCNKVTGYKYIWHKKNRNIPETALKNLFLKAFPDAEEDFNQMNYYACEKHSCIKIPFAGPEIVAVCAQHLDPPG